MFIQRTPNMPTLTIPELIDFIQKCYEKKYPRTKGTNEQRAVVIMMNYIIQRLLASLYNIITPSQAQAFITTCYEDKYPTSNKGAQQKAVAKMVGYIVEKLDTVQ